MRPAPTEAVAEKLREMGMSAGEAARVAKGEVGAGRGNLSLEHRAAISDTKRSSARRFVREENAAPETPRQSKREPTIIPPLPVRTPLCPTFDIVARSGAHGVSVARVTCVDGAERVAG